MAGNDAATRRGYGWREALDVAVGRAHGPALRSFAVAGAVGLGVVPLAAFDSLVTTAGVTVLSAGVFVLCLAVVAFCMLALITAHVGLDGDGGTADAGAPRAAERHGIVVLWSLAALLYGVEAVSAFCAVVLGSTDGLWAARRFFLWHVADTVPVFAITDTFGLTKPALSLEAARILALALKIALILPLIRAAVAAFRAFDGSGGTDDRGAFRLFTPRRLRNRSDPDARLSSWASAVRALVVIVVCGGLLSLSLTVCNWVGPVSKAIASALPPAPGQFVRAAGDRILEVLGSLLVQYAILAVLSAVLTVSTWLILRGLLRADLGVLSRITVGLAVLFASLMSLLLVFSTAVALDLLATCMFEGRPPMIEAAGRLDWFAWHSMDVLPEWSVPGVLDWQEPAGPGSWWSGVLLMLAKLIAVLVIAVPVARVARAARRTWLDRIARSTGSP